MSNVSLKSLLAPNKKVSTEFPGLPGFLVELAFLSRENILAIRKKATRQLFKAGRAKIEEEFDEELFLQLYSEQTVLGWSGLKFNYLEKLAPVELNGLDPEDELEFTKENALYLLKNSTDFDNFVSDKVSNLGNFSQSK